MRGIEVRTFLRGAALAALGIGGCGDWPVQMDSPNGGGTSTPSGGQQCVTLPGVGPSNSGQVNGGLCFGIAIDSSAALQCAPSATANLTQCVDTLTGVRYVVRWTGGSGTVHDPVRGDEIGTVRAVGAGTFQVTTTLVDGVCTISAGPPAQATWCVQT